MSSKDLVISKLSDSPLVKEYKQMLTNINNGYLLLKNQVATFYKSHSQFMGVMLGSNNNYTN